MRFASFLLLAFIVLLSACHSGDKGSTKQEMNTVESAEKNIALPFDTTAGRNFLVTAIEGCFNSNNGKYESIVTKRYSQLLDDGFDLLTLQMEGDESEAAMSDKYYKKWEQAYSSIDTSFLHPDTWVICAQDWDKVRCNDTRYLRHDTTAVWYGAVITTGLESKDQPPCKRDFRIVKEGNAFKIDYVKHHIGPLQEF